MKIVQDVGLRLLQILPPPPPQLKLVKMVQDFGFEVAKKTLPPQKFSAHYPKNTLFLANQD